MNDNNQVLAKAPLFSQTNVPLSFANRTRKQLKKIGQPPF